MTVKDVGKIPYAMTTYDQTEWITDKDLAKPVGSLRSKVSSRSGILDSTFENEDVRLHSSWKLINRRFLMIDKRSPTTKQISSTIVIQVFNVFIAIFLDRKQFTPCTKKLSMISPSIHPPLQCYFQLSPGGGDPPWISNSPRKTPKIQKTLKNASNLPPCRYVFPNPHRTWSIELTLPPLNDHSHSPNTPSPVWFLLVSVCIHPRSRLPAHAQLENRTVSSALGLGKASDAGAERRWTCVYEVLLEGLPR